MNVNQIELLSNLINGNSLESDQPITKRQGRIAGGKYQTVDDGGYDKNKKSGFKWNSSNEKCNKSKKDDLDIEVLEEATSIFDQKSKNNLIEEIDDPKLKKKPEMYQKTETLETYNIKNENKNKNDKSKDIWSAEEINNTTTPNQIQDLLKNLKSSKITPNYNITYQQDVSADDVFLGLSQKQDTINDCNRLKIIIDLPKCDNMKELDLELKKNVLNLTSEKYYLRVDLPEEVDPVNQAKAKFHKEKKQLTVSARIVG